VHLFSWRASWGLQIINTAHRRPKYSNMAYGMLGHCRLLRANNYLKPEQAKRRCNQQTSAARHRHKCLKEGRRAVQVLRFKADKSDAGMWYGSDHSSLHYHQRNPMHPWRKCT